MNFFKKLFGNISPEEPEKREPIKIDVEEKFQKAMQVLSIYKRTAYVPVTQKSEREALFSPGSKIGGFPYLRNEKDWPVCPNCKKHMQLFLQLNLNELPVKKENGLVQLFYCTTSEPHCESESEAFFPFSTSVECRRIKLAGDSAFITPVIDEIFPESVITGWEAKDDYPHYEEYELLGIELELSDEVSELMDEREMGSPLQKDKLFGWPYWVQSVEYPSDRNTNKQMEILYQLDSEDNLPYMFGDVGIGHLTQSQDNKNELAFGWACH